MKKKYIRTAATRKKQSEARKAYWKNKALQSRFEVKEAMVDHVKQHVAIQKKNLNQGFFDTVLSLIGL